jgi:hypothetical protein
MGLTTDPRRYQEQVEEALRRHGFTDPMQAMCGLLWLLEDVHTNAIAFGKGVDSNGRTISPVDIIGDLVDEISAINHRIADHRRGQGDIQEADRQALKASLSACLSEMLDGVRRQGERNGIRLKECGIRTVVT